MKLFAEGEEGILPPLFDPTIVRPTMMTMMKMKEEEEEEKMNVMPSAEEMEMKIRRGRDVFTAVGCGRTNIYEASINQQSQQDSPRLSVVCQAAVPGRCENIHGEGAAFRTRI